MPFLKMNGKMAPQLTRKVSLTMSLFIWKTGKYILKIPKIVTHLMLFKRWKKSISTLQRTRLTNHDLQILLDQRSMSILKIILKRIFLNTSCTEEFVATGKLSTFRMLFAAQSNHLAVILTSCLAQSREMFYRALLLNVPPK